MKDSSKKIFLVLSILLILTQVGIFIYAAAIPITWQQEEIVQHGFLWSMDGLDQFTLHTGFQKEDFLKPFASYYVDGIFRTRQVSYFLEMVSFKFWQYFGKVFFQNYTLIGIHLLNVLLLWMLVFRLTREKWTAWISSLLFLNAGVSLATLLFPFRNAKLLVMTFFLIGWLIIAASKGKFSKSSPWRLFGFFLTMLLAFFTDEIAFFIFPLLFIYVAFRDGTKGLFNPRMMIAVVVTLVLWKLLASGALHMASYISDPQASTGEVKRFIHNVGIYLTNPQSYFDILKAFFSYFLRRNFGYWDWTPLGMAAGVAAGVLLFGLFWGKPLRLESRLCLSLGIIIFLKAIFLPHNSGYHSTFMPEGTVFPSLFFFSYYYVYAEAVLFSLLIGLLYHRLRFSRQRFIFIMGLVTLMSLSNVVHLKEGPPDAMKFGNWKDNAYRRKVVKSVLAAGDALNEEKLWPLYLSFPSGDLELVKGRRTDQPELNRYTRYILTRYLRSFEERRGIVSFKNVKAKVPFKSDSELFNARFFLDVPSGEIYDLEHLRNKKGATAMVPEEIMRSAPRTMSQRIPKRHIDNIIFFIKGRTTFLLYVDKQKILAGQQFYGQSYQKFEISLKDMSFQPRPIISLKLKPVSEDHPAYLIGPFVFNKD